MAKVILYNKSLEFEPIIALIYTDSCELKLFYRVENLDELKKNYYNHIETNEISLISNLLYTREKLVRDYLFKIIDRICIDYVIEKNDCAKFNRCEKTIYFTFVDLSFDLKKKGSNHVSDSVGLYLTSEKHSILIEYFSH